MRAGTIIRPRTRRMYIYITITATAVLAVPAVACLAVVGYKMRVLPGTAAVPRITNLLELERKENI